MTTDWQPFLIYAVDLLFLVVLARVRHGLMVMAVMNMLAIAAFGQISVSFLGFLTNAGNPFYAMVILVMSLKAREGMDGGRVLNACNLIFAAMLFRLFSGMVIERRNNLALIFGCFVSFYLSQFVNFKMLKLPLPVWLAKPVANVTAQACDSLFFFPIVFYGAPGWAWRDAMIGGFLLKSLLNVLDTPVYLWILKRQKAAALAVLMAGGLALTGCSSIKWNGAYFGAQNVTPLRGYNPSGDSTSLYFNAIWNVGKRCSFQIEPILTVTHPEAPLLRLAFDVKLF